MTSSYTVPQEAVDHAPSIQPAKKQTITIDGFKITLNFSDNPDKTAISEVKRIILNGLAKTS